MKRTLIIFIFLIISFILISCNFNNILIKNIIYKHNEFYLYKDSSFYITLIHISQSKSRKPLDIISKTAIEITPLKEGLIDSTFELRFDDTLIIPQLGNNRRSLVAETLDFIKPEQISIYKNKQIISTPFISIMEFAISTEKATSIADNKIKEYMKMKKIRKLEVDFKLKIIESEFDGNYKYYIEYLTLNKLFALIIDSKTGKILAENFLPSLQE